MGPTNDLNLPLHDDDARYFLEGSYEDGTDYYGNQRYVIIGRCNQKGDAIEAYLVREDGKLRIVSSMICRRIVSSMICRRTGKHSVGFVEMGSGQRLALEKQLTELGVL